VRRRQFIAVLGGAAASPLTGSAQQAKRLRRVGALMGFSEQDPFAQSIVSAFAQALGGFGWVECTNTTDLPPLVQLSARPTRRNWSAWRPTPFSRAPHRQSRCYASGRVRYRSYSHSCPTPSAWALFRASRGRRQHHRVQRRRRPISGAAVGALLNYALTSMFIWGRRLSRGAQPSRRVDFSSRRQIRDG